MLPAMEHCLTSLEHPPQQMEHPPQQMEHPPQRMKHPRRVLLPGERHSVHPPGREHPRCRLVKKIWQSYCIVAAVYDRRFWRIG